LGLHDPVWFLDFNLFITELKNNFGSFDPEGKAEAELEALCMHENHQAMKYFIKFQQLASRVQWVTQHSNNRLIMDSPSASKMMVHHNKPDTLSGL